MDDIGRARTPATTWYTGSSAWKTRRLRNDPRGGAAARAIANKYGWQRALARGADAPRERFGRGDAPVAIRVRLDTDS